MIRRSTILITVAIYFLTPYSIRNITATCQCGCQEFICYCCRSPENFCGVTSIAECRCDTNDEIYVHCPGAMTYAFQMGLILDQTGDVIYDDHDSILPGYKDPPMKPPPTAQEKHARESVTGCYDDDDVLNRLS